MKSFIGKLTMTVSLPQFWCFFFEKVLLAFEFQDLPSDICIKNYPPYITLTEIMILNNKHTFCEQIRR